VIRSFRASRMITMCVTHFRCSSASITCMHVILPCFFKELELYLCIWYIYIYNSLLLCRRKDTKMYLHCCNNIIEHMYLMEKMLKT
jgi:hypothetical protein